MADFRRVVTAFAVLVLLTGLAVSANAADQAFGCNASAAVPPLLRAEGLTELAGDIVLNCTGSIGTPGTANFTVFVGNTVVTSRITDTGTNASEALLLINEPGTAGNPDAPVLGTTAFQGVVSGNSVTFLGVPVNPPSTNLIYRITNVRINASTIGGGPGGTPGQVQAFISISGSTSVPINNPTQVIGFVQNGLTFDLRASNPANASTGFSLKQCDNTSHNKVIEGYLRFTELFATAFKTKGDTGQTVPGAVYNTESGLTVLDLGAADSGTRLRATFANIPTGTTVYVSSTNVVAGAAGTSAAARASETSGSAASTTGSFTAGAGSDITMIPVSISSTGGGEAVWEVTSASPLLTESLDFAVGFGYTPSPGTNVPASGVQGTVAGSFAPAPPTLDATAAAKASATLPIPRFVDSNILKNLIIFNICQTRLLFPYAVNTSLFDTGLAISNTSKDPFGTTPQTGTCTLNFYGNNAPASSLTTDSIGDGTTLGPVYAATLLSIAPGFQGYVIATCNFQFAHGFAFVSDIGAHNLAMGYLALIIPDTRVATEALNQ